jgi:hypothetical protein
MTHDELLADIKEQIEVRKELGLGDIAWSWNALRAVVELHVGKGINNRCVVCSHGNKCETIQVIEKELA